MCRALTVGLVLVAACTSQSMAEVGDGGTRGAAIDSCDGARAVTIDYLWTQYLQAAAASGTGGCALMSCHGRAGAGGGGMHFTNAAEFVTATVDVKASTGNGMMRVKMSDPAHSYLLRRLLPDAGERRMPPGGPYLDDQAVEDMVGWICSGKSGGADGGIDGGRSP